MFFFWHLSPLYQARFLLWPSSLHGPVRWCSEDCSNEDHGLFFRWFLFSVFAPHTHTHSLTFLFLYIENCFYCSASTKNLFPLCISSFFDIFTVDFEALDLFLVSFVPLRSVGELCLWFTLQRMWVEHSQLSCWVI